MDLPVNNLIALALATAVLVALPGPNAALIVANSLRGGMRAGAVTVFGTTLGVAVQLALVVLGFVAIIEIAADVLTWVRWAGVVYLIWLGVLTFRAPADDLAVSAAPAVFWRGCMIAALNPKTLLFNAAFLPQFAPSDAGAPEFVVIATLFLTLLLLGDLLWALFASSARKWLRDLTALRNKLTGGFLVLAGIGLALARREL